MGDTLQSAEEINISLRNFQILFKQELSDSFLNLVKAVEKRGIADENEESLAAFKTLVQHLTIATYNLQFPGYMA